MNVYKLLEPRTCMANSFLKPDHGILFKYTRPSCKGRAREVVTRTYFYGLTSAGTKPSLTLTLWGDEL
jgi:hypothetical protein